jgi:hypothetical protein
MKNKITPEQEKEMYRHRLEYLESRIGSMTDHEQWEAVAEIKRLTAAPPAIPEGVCETLEKIVEHELSIEDFSDWEEDDLLAARAYLSDAPVASDKAVCPKCGSIALLISQYVGASGIKCAECSHFFERQIAFIPPPRTEKGDK